MINSVAVKTVIVIFLRHVAPFLGAAGILGDGEYEQIAGAVVLLGSIGYHVYKRLSGKTEVATEIATAKNSDALTIPATPDKELKRRG